MRLVNGEWTGVPLRELQERAELALKGSRDAVDGSYGVIALMIAITPFDFSRSSSGFILAGHVRPYRPAIKANQSISR